MEFEEADAFRSSSCRVCDDVWNIIVSFLHHSRPTLSGLPPSGPPPGLSVKQHRTIFGNGRLCLGTHVSTGLRSVCKKLHRLAKEVESTPLFEIPRHCIRLKASHDVLGGGTGAEFVENLLVDFPNAWNKWYATYVPCTVTYAFSSPFIIQAYGLCLANDCPHRDPMDWEIAGISKTGKGMVVHTVKDGIPMTAPRFSWHFFTLPEPVEMSCFVFNVQASASKRYEVQLAQLAVFGRDV